MRLNRWVMAIVFLLLAGVSLWVNINKPRLLILHSYSKDYVWTHDIDQGFERVLRDEGWLTVRYHYMKTKLFHGDDALRRAGIAAREAIERERPDVVLAVDDYAQKLAAKYFVDHPDISIVFAGINGSIEPYGYDKARNVTGILERKPVAALRETMLMLSSHREGEPGPRALFLADTAYSSELDAKFMAGYDWAPVRYQPVVYAQDYDQWKAVVSTIGERADYLLVGGYRKLPRHAGDQSYVSASEVMSWTEANSSVPVIGMNVFNSADGAMLSVGVSPYEQAEVSLRMALDIIRGRREAHYIPIATSSQYVVALRRSSLEKRGLKMPRIFEAFARATDNFYP